MNAPWRLKKGDEEVRKWDNADIGLDTILLSSISVVKFILEDPAIDALRLFFKNTCGSILDPTPIEMFRCIQWVFS